MCLVSFIGAFYDLRLRYINTMLVCILMGRPDVLKRQKDFDLEQNSLTSFHIELHSISVQKMNQQAGKLEAASSKKQDLELTSIFVYYIEVISISLTKTVYIRGTRPTFPQSKVLPITEKIQKTHYALFCKKSSGIQCQTVKKVER